MGRIRTGLYGVMGWVVAKGMGLFMCVRWVKGICQYVCAGCVEVTGLYVSVRVSVGCGKIEGRTGLYVCMG